VIYTHSIEQATKYCDQAYARIMAEGLTPHPEAFTVLYLHYSKIAPEISKTLDILESNKQKITDSVISDLYNTHCGYHDQTETVAETTERIQTALDQVIAVLDEGNRDAGTYTENLAGFAGALGQGNDLSELRSMVLTIAAETRSMIEHTRRLDKMLTDTSTQMASMRVHLDSVRRETITDALTGIKNRKYFDDYLRESAIRSMETGEPLTILMTDIDFFKKFNDTWGHQTGDEVLKLVARVLSAAAKTPFAACRYGGEEFAIIMPKTPLRDAATIAEHVRAQVEKKKIIRRQTNENLGNITMSIGLSEYTPGESLVDFVHRADEALYKAHDDEGM